MTQAALGSLIAACALSAYACAPPRDVDLARTVRLVSSPTSISELSEARASAALPAEITFGSSQGRSALYLKFPANFAAYRTPLKAFIALSPREDATADATPVVVEAWRVNAAWEATEMRAWSDKPPLAPPSARAQLDTSPARELRIDVTELMRFAAQNPALDFGFALLGQGGPGHGASFATGISGGDAPRLEVYVR
ncbi:MAG: DNRLRE domain-containing protein [Polyangiaceae bacterium]